MYFHGKDEEMPLIRKTRISGRSIIITLSSQIVDASYIKNRDFLESLSIQQAKILMKKTKGELVW
jgi:hypothetical protein